MVASDEKNGEDNSTPYKRSTGPTKSGFADAMGDPSFIVEPMRASLKEELRSVPGYDEFEIDIEKVIRGDLPAHFSSIETAPLTAANINLIPERAKGAYMLFQDDRAVYAGKTDTRHGFRNRLSRHHYTLQHRRGIDIARMSFKAVRIMVFSNFDAEAILIDEMRRRDPDALPWNNTGFGSNDPGHNRELEEPGEFDRSNPINLDTPLDPPLLQPGPVGLLPALLAMKEGLPYTFRYGTDIGSNGKPVSYRKGHADQRDDAAIVLVPASPLFTMRAFLKEALRVMPNGWRVTVFPGRVILYKEENTYPYALESFTR